jgi:HupE / UreJ protein
MSEFIAYLKLGFQHITDFKGIDHVLFILALCSIYKINEWRIIGILITAFTIGHSVTLAIATFEIVKINNDWVEFLIPVTILITCCINILNKIPERKPYKEKISLIRYHMALFFGLIHGLGFSNYLRSLIGKEESILKPLLFFNLGLELGQLLIVFILLVIATVFFRFFNVKQRDWKLVLSGIIAGMALFLIKDSAIFE